MRIFSSFSDQILMISSEVMYVFVDSDFRITIDFISWTTERSSPLLREMDHCILLIIASWIRDSGCTTNLISCGFVQRILVKYFGWKLVRQMLALLQIIKKQETSFLEGKRSDFLNWEVRLCFSSFRKI